MLSFLYHDPSFPSDLAAIFECTMRMCIRPECESDRIFVEFALREIKSQKRETSGSSEETQDAGKDAISNLNAKLDDFLSMYENMDDEEEEEEENENEMVTEQENNESFVNIGSSFTCALCHGSETSGERNTPVLLCHFDKSRINSKRSFFSFIIIELDTYNGLFHEANLDKTQPIPKQYQECIRSYFIFQ